MNNNQQASLGHAAHFELQHNAVEVAHARRITRQFLNGSPEDVVAVAQLLTSELVSNAVQHGAGRIRLSLDCADCVLCIGVADEATGRPRMRRPAISEARGRGLLMLERLALAWGVTSDGTRGKTVWFTLRTG